MLSDTDGCCRILTDALRMLGGVRDVCMPAPPVAEEENTDAPRLHTLAHTAADEETSGASGRVEIASTILELKAEACNRYPHLC